MTEVKEYEPGRFCWAELGTTNAASAKNFYNALFGWEFEDAVLANGIYTVLRRGGGKVAGLYELNADQLDRGVPSHWLSFISVRNADESTAMVKALGGTVLGGPRNVQDIGRMSIVADPAGAVFALWQAGTHQGASLIGVPSSVYWNELLTTEPAVVEPFYMQLLGWQKETLDLGSAEYVIFRNGDQSAAGMQPGGADVPPYWLTYFGVDDCDAASRKTQDLGGSVLVDPQDIPAVGRVAVLVDPQSAVFAILQVASPNA